MRFVNNKEKFFSMVLFAVAVIFYLYFAFWDGAVICADSPSYIDMSISREFLYPSLLAIFRWIFGEQYLLLTVVLQSMLAAVAAWNVTIYLKKQFSLGYLVSIVIFAIPMFVSLLNRFAAGRGAMYSNSILTEGITIPLFMLFFRYLFEYLVNHKRSALVWAAVITGVLIATRKQMYVALILLFFAVIYAGIIGKQADCTELGKKHSRKENTIKKNAGRAVVRAAVLCAGILLLVTFLDHGYNYIVRGRFVGHSSDNRFVLTMVFYASEEEYAEELPTELQPLFLSIYEECDSQGYLMHSAQKGWYNQVVHFGDSYDLIQINTMWPAIQNYVEEHYTEDSTERELLTDDITNVMIASLMKKTAPKIIQALFNNVLSGLVTTVAQRTPILIWYSLAAYVGYVGLLLYHFRVIGRLDAAGLLCVLTLVSILVNVGLVSAVIFCQTRYTIYNMPLFYMSGVILLKEIWDAENFSINNKIDKC